MKLGKSSIVVAVVIQPCFVVIPTILYEISRICYIFLVKRIQQRRCSGDGRTLKIWSRGVFVPKYGRLD